jgi:hypothetical protein
VVFEKLRIVCVLDLCANDVDLGDRVRASMRRQFSSHSYVLAAEVVVDWKPIS